MSGVIRSFRDLDAWQVGMDLVVAIYDLADALPTSERFGLSAQMRRAAVSVPSNLAEGHAKRGKAYRYHALVALGSTAELDTQMEAAVRLKFLTAAQIAAARELIAREGQMLQKLARALQREQIARSASTLASFLAGTSAVALLSILR